MLYLNNIPIPLPATFSVRLEWVNPFCYFDKVPGNAALGMEIEVNEYTRAIFGNPERFEKYSKVSSRKFPGFTIRKQGTLLEAGSLVITDANDETYSAWLQPEMGVMGEAQRDKFIPDLEWKTDVEFDDKEEYIPGTDEYAIVKLKNEHFWEGKGAPGRRRAPADPGGNKKLLLRFLFRKRRNDKPVSNSGGRRQHGQGDIALSVFPLLR